MSVSAKMLSLLRDPLGLEPLELDGEHLVNRAAQRRYPIIESIPVLLESATLGPQNLKFQRMYDWMSYGYDFAMKVGGVFSGGKLAKLRRLLATKLALKPGDRCLYTSIGTGADVPYLAEQVPLESVELVGLDLSLGMLRRCKAKIRPYDKTSLLVQANAERLPFADRTFDVVFHVGGINFFDQPAVAVREMVRVARAGALILIADETKVVVEKNYQRSPFTRAYFKDAPTDFSPRDWVPPGVCNPVYEEVWKGKGYILTFNTPVS
jgi:ubiquinone/menaquinone biosynthesis C-methylase UbiE